MSKGSDRRPLKVSSKKFSDNWDKAFGKIKQSETITNNKKDESK